MILRTVSESSTIITSGRSACTTAIFGTSGATRSALGSKSGTSVRCASWTGLMIRTTSPLPSTVAPAIPDTRASCGPMFFTTTS